MSASITLATFDIFDTVLTRTIGSPNSGFYLLGHWLSKLSLIDCSAEAFARARAEAERRAFKNAGGLDSHVNLAQIYAELKIPLRLNEDACTQLMSYELELEKNILKPVPRALEIVQEARRLNQQVAFVSDMYLHTAYIKELLSANELLQPGDSLYVSSEYARSKHTGSLYREVLKQHKVSVKQVVHCGNHPHADVKIARQLGIAQRPFYEGNLNRYEQILETQAGATDGLSSAMAGASRLVRLTIPADSAKEKHLRDVSAGIAAPLLTGFVLWVLRRAQKMGLQRLYFVSRDGQILLEIARRLIKKLDFDCDLRYLYGSRQAWMLPSITGTEEENLSRSLFLEAHFVSVEAALDRLGIQPAEVEPMLVTIGFTQEKWKQNLSGEERRAFRQFILNNEDIHSLILNRARQTREITVHYLRQEGLLDGTPFAMIDLGTGATLHSALTEILRTAGGSTFTSFYLGYTKKTLNAKHGQVEPYFFDKRDETGFDIVGLVQALEIICSGDHGSVVGYRGENGKTVPVLTESVNHKVLDWGYKKIADTISLFADTLLLDKNLLNPWADVRSVTFKAFEAFWQKPSPGEARAWGSFLMEDGWGNQAQWLQIAESYQWKHLPGILKKGQLQLRKHWWSWGALTLTPSPLRSILNGMILSKQGLDYAMPRIKKRLKNRKME